jgi:hypothetical protein
MPSGGRPSPATRWTTRNQHHGHAEHRRVKLPVPGNIMGYGAIPIGGPEDFYQLCKEEEWTLPFELWGYYDLRQTHGA